MMSIKEFYRRFEEALNSKYYAEQTIRRLKYAMQYNVMVEKALHCTENGITENPLCGHEVVVSLTTYGRRLYDVAITIESIMQGSMKPNRLVLCLGEDLRDTILPIALQNQQKRGLEILYCKDVRSFTKLIPTLKKYPEANIITIDDDQIYGYDLVEKLFNTHIKNPKHIIANRIHRIVLGKDGHPLDYMKWNFSTNPSDDSTLNFFTGVGGVLYPPHSLHPEVLNENVFLDICKHADDIWFYAMSLLAKTKTIKCYTQDLRGEGYLTNEDVQDTGLCHINLGKNCANDIQFKAVFDRYNLWDYIKE